MRNPLKIHIELLNQLKLNRLLLEIFYYKRFREIELPEEFHKDP